MMHIRAAKFRTMNVFVAVPSICGIPLNEGTQTIVKSGTWRRYSSRVSGRRNMFLAKWLCQASSVTIRIGILYAGSAPA